ncbi:MAG: AarF/ABC1/UbiB kinase family protein, partial [Pseudomonadota bacterium]
MDDVSSTEKPSSDEPERNRLSGRVKRYAKVGTDVGGVAARLAGQRVFGSSDMAGNAKALKEALGGLKGPLMKVAQLMATIPDALPPEYA